MNIPDDHAYCRDKASEKPVEISIEKVKKEKPEILDTKPAEKSIRKSTEKSVQTAFKSSNLLKKENNNPVLREKIIRTNPGYYQSLS